VRESRSGNYISNTSTVNSHNSSVGIQELREAERQFHQRQGSSEHRSQVVRQRRVYAIATCRNTPRGIRRTTDNIRDIHSGVGRAKKSGGGSEIAGFRELLSLDRRPGRSLVGGPGVLKNSI